MLMISKLGMLRLEILLLMILKLIILLLMIFMLMILTLGTLLQKIYHTSQCVLLAEISNVGQLKAIIQMLNILF